MPRLTKKKDNYFIRQGDFIIKMLKKAGIIVMNYETNEVYAGRIREIHTISQFQAGCKCVQPDSIRFNFKTQKL
jgi:hypothetical protein